MIKRSALPLSRRASGVARVLAYETYPAHVEGSASGGKCRLRKAVLEIAPLLREILRGVPDMLLHFLNALVGHLGREQSHGERCYSSSKTGADTHSKAGLYSPSTTATWNVLVLQAA